MARPQARPAIPRSPVRPANVSGLAGVRRPEDGLDRPAESGTFPSQRKATSVAEGGHHLDQGQIPGGTARRGPGREMAAVGACVELSLDPGSALGGDVDGRAGHGDVGERAGGQAQRDPGPGRPGPRAGPPQAGPLPARAGVRRAGRDHRVGAGGACGQVEYLLPATGNRHRRPGPARVAGTEQPGAERPARLGRGETDLGDALVLPGDGGPDRAEQAPGAAPVAGADDIRARAMTARRGAENSSLRRRRPAERVSPKARRDRVHRAGAAGAGGAGGRSA